MRTAFHSLFLALLITATAVGDSAAKDARTVSTRSSVSEARTSGSLEEAVYRLSPSKDVTMQLLGTTPIRDWKMSAHGLSGEARMTMSAERELLEIRDLEFSLPVHNLRGDVRAMEEDAYEALKADRHREITFKLRSATVTPKTATHYIVAAKGALTVAGVTREVTLKMYSNIGTDGAVTFTGSQVVRMSDYNVERPTLLFGAIKAGDDMTLTYKLIFTKQ